MNVISPFITRAQELYAGFYQSPKPTTPIYDDCKHTIADANRNFFDLCDGSRWFVDGADRSNFTTLNPGSGIVIVATSDQKKYEIVKINLAGEVISSVKASLYMSPWQSNIDGNTVSAFEILMMGGDHISINYLAPLIRYPIPLMVKVSTECKEEMKRWTTGDVIMLGLVHSPNHPEYNPNEVMLINCTLDSHIHGTTA